MSFNNRKTCSFRHKMLASAISRNSSHTTTPSDNSQQNCLPPLLRDYCLYIQRMNFKNEQNYSYTFIISNYNKLYLENKYNNLLFYLKNIYVKIVFVSFNIHQNLHL